MGDFPVSQTVACVGKNPVRACMVYESFKVYYIELLGFRSKCFFRSWRKRSAMKQPRVLRTIWAVRFLFLVKREGEKNGNINLEVVTKYYRKLKELKICKC